MKTETEHTAGLSFTFDGFGINDKNNPYCERIATLTKHGQAIKGVGQLLESAPELLEACIKANEYFKAIDSLQPQRDRGNIGRDVRSLIEAAIARAKGQP